jgi:excisionase family DNA binding protein
VALPSIEPTFPSDQDADLAEKVRRAIADAAGSASLSVQVKGAGRRATTFDLPPALTRLLLNILKEMAAGHAVSLVTLEAEITTQQAAELLNVSRPYVIGMIDKGTLPARLVGNQRRLPLREVLVYKAKTRAKRRKTLDRLVAHDQKLGLFDSE